MTRFATILKDPDTRHPVLLWEETDGRFQVVSRHASVDGLDEDVDVHAFDVATTMGKGSALNAGGYPTVDGDGAPLWKGARIEFTVPSYHVNTVSGSGAFTSVDRYGGTYYVSDEPLPVYGDRNGGSSGRSTSRYSPWDGFDHDGELKGHRRLAGGLGDPHEHGVTKTFIRLVSDPRDACTPVPSPAPAP